MVTAVGLVSEHASPLAAIGGHDAGGQNVYVHSLATELARRSIDTTVYTRRDDPVAPDEVRSPTGYRVVHLDAGPPEPITKDEIFPHLGQLSASLERAVRARPVQVLHSHFWMSGLAALAVRRELGVPVAHTFHALGSVKRRHQAAADTSPLARVGLERDLASSVDAVVATCSDEVEELRAMGARPASTAVVPCGVDPSTFVPRRRRRRARGRHVVAIGRLVPRKGFDDLVAALGRVPGSVLTVVGGPARAHLDDDADIRRLRAVAAACGVEDRVRFTGRLDQTDVAALLADADVCACPSWYEPFGIVPLEAMACGVPVVATAVGGFLDTVVDGATGRLCPPRRPDALAAALRAVLEADADERAALGRAGRARVERRYTWSAVADDVVDVYRAVARPPLRRATGAGYPA